MIIIFTSLLVLFSLYASSSHACISYSSEKYNDSLVQAWFRVNAIYQRGYQTAKLSRDVIYSAMNNKQIYIVHLIIAQTNKH